jgi:CubicO group peptidase (beta-lactamase class C family)
MNIYYKTLLILLLFSASTMQAQTEIKDYEVQWEGKLNNKNAFNFSVSLKFLNDNEYNFSIYNEDFNFNKKVKSTATNYIEFNIDNNTSFNGVLNKKKSEINGFISSGFYFYHVQLMQSENGTYTGKWNIFMLDEVLSKSIYLSIENVTAANFDAFPFFGDQRFAGTYAMNSKLNGNTITFQDARTGLHFRGKLLKETIQLEILVANTVFTSVTLKKSTTEWKLGQYSTSKNNLLSLNDGWEIDLLKNTILLKKLEDSILQKKLINTHSVLIAKKGKLIYEKYFEGFTNNTPHDQRSASKSIASAITGIAINDKLIKTDADFLYDYIPKAYRYTKDTLKSAIKIKDLLTMSSGLDAVDFGVTRKSKASEPAFQNSQDWLKTVLEAPMIHKPGTVANYGSANPYLLGVILNELTPIPLQLYMDQKLFKPLGISNYTIQKEIAGNPYFGGGMYITSRDMLKFGQLYISKGKWNGKRIVSKKWVEKSFKNYLELKNTKDKNGYGYLWWHKTYTINGKDIKSIEARGNGGQYIFVIPALKTVCVITAGNYRSTKTQQPEYILENYILPSLL